MLMQPWNPGPIKTGAPYMRVLSVSSRNHRSTRFNYDEEVGVVVKCGSNRGCDANQACTSTCLSVA